MDVPNTGMQSPMPQQPMQPAPQGNPMNQAPMQAPQPKKTNTALVVIGVVVVILLIFGAIAWYVGQAVYKTATNAYQNINATSNSLNVQTNQGNLSAQTGTLPSDFPTDIPQYAGATVTAGAKTNLGGITTYTGTFSSTDSVATITAYYKTALADKGWSIVTTLDYGTQSQFVAKMGSRQLTVGMVARDGKTIITIVQSQAN